MVMRKLEKGEGERVREATDDVPRKITLRFDTHAAQGTYSATCN